MAETAEDSSHQIVRQQKPLNTEPDSEQLDDHFITPTSQVFHRNHDSIIKSSTPTAASKSSQWKVSFAVDSGVGDTQLRALSPRAWNLTSIQNDFPRSEVIATLECAGNRRAEFASLQKPEGIQWGNAVIANVIWGGASLRQVLLSAGVSDPYAHHSAEKQFDLSPSDEAIERDAAGWSKDLHLHMLSVQESTESDDPTRTEVFASSIPLATAMHPNQMCLLAYQHNREPLLDCHGAPLRAVLPGHVGARWVKWLAGLKISTQENDSPPMRQDYKLLVPPESKGSDFIKQASHDADFRKQQLKERKPLQRLEASSSITHPTSQGDKVELRDGQLDVKGYAVGCNGSPPAHVYATIVPDPGSETITEDLLESLPSDIEWHEAQFINDMTEAKYSWAWRLWQVDLPVPSDLERFSVVARCVTANGIEQEKISTWNLRGFCNRSWPVVRNLTV